MASFGSSTRFPAKEGPYPFSWNGTRFLAVCKVIFYRQPHPKGAEYMFEPEWNVTRAYIQVQPSVIVSFALSTLTAAPAWSEVCIYSFLNIWTCATIIPKDFYNRSEREIFIRMYTTCSFSSTAAYKWDAAGTGSDLQLIIWYHYWISRTPGVIF